MTITDQQLHTASIRQVVDYLQDCLKAEQAGATPQGIAGYMTALLAYDNPRKWYGENRYPELTQILDEAPNLEIGNVVLSEKEELLYLKQLVWALDRRTS